MTKHSEILPALMFAVALSTASTTGAAAETVEIQMLNYDREDPSRVMIFKPEVIRIQPGDTVRWVSVDDFHNTASIDGMIPEGAEPWESELSADFEYTFEQEGTYGYLCMPHSALGMVGLVLVGDGTVNLEAAKAVEHAMQPMTDKFADLFSQVD